MTWTRTLPIRLEPVDGEALDSWLEVLALAPAAASATSSWRSDCLRQTNKGPDGGLLN